jgi:bis(5'-nucleosyl)-tetraphosphatase (symmetrical)
MNTQPPIWLVGDVQGCCPSLDALLAHPDIAGDPDARFWFAGDIVNRGPDSLGALKRIMDLGDRAVVVLGNHDLHLLAVAANVSKTKKSDTINDILTAPDYDDLIDWLRHRPLAHFAYGHLLVHAGVPPQWDVDKTLALAAEAESALQGPDWKQHLQSMYGDKPDAWTDALDGEKRLRTIINGLTRMRMCRSNGQMEFSYKKAPKDAPDGLVAWFDVPGRAIRDATVVFGHWSTLGLLIRPDVICLDTGCIWGRKLTAVRLQDHKVVQVECKQYSNPLVH